MNEYIVRYRIGTVWHEPYNTTTFNYYTELVEAETAKQAVRKEFSVYYFSNPNKFIELLSVKKV